MILRKDYVKLIKEGKAQVEVEKTEEHNEMLNLIFPNRNLPNNAEYIYYKIEEGLKDGYDCEDEPFNLPIIHASDIILDNTVIKVESEEHGKRVIEWWKEQGLNLDGVEGSAVGSCYGIYNGSFNFFNHDIAIRKGEKIITLPETFPSKWYLKITDSNKKVANEWRESICSSNWKGDDMDNCVLLSKHDCDKSYYCGITYFQGAKSLYEDYSEISTEQFLEHVYKPFKAKQKQENKQEEKMRTITWNQGQAIIDTACINWKTQLFDRWGKSIVMKESIEVDDRFYGSMRKACTKEQHELFDKIFGKEKEEISLGGVMIKNDYIHLRIGGEYQGKALVLNEDYSWEIKKDKHNFLCLIPTHK